jgi:hypothetical protein
MLSGSSKILKAEHDMTTSLRFIQMETQQFTQLNQLVERWENQQGKQCRSGKPSCRAALNSRNCLQNDELLQLNPGILDSQCT